MKRMPRRQRDEEQYRGLYVHVQNNDVNRALRKFKKKIAEDGLMQELRKREYYESRGTKKRLAKAAAIRRYKKNQAKRLAQEGY